jgi:acylphosphatase
LAYNSEEVKRLKITVSGKVQDVWFRKYTADMATNLGLVGWVKNTEEGTVVIEAQGNDESLSGLVKWCKTGSPMAIVDQVVSEEIPISHELQFRING